MLIVITVINEMILIKTAVIIMIMIISVRVSVAMITALMYISLLKNSIFSVSNETPYITPYITHAVTNIVVYILSQ